MMDRQTAAYPPRPLPPTHAATMVATASATSETMMADGSQTLLAPASIDASHTLLAGSPTYVGSTNAGTLPPSGPRSLSTVLPEVRSEGERLVIVPRDKTRYETAKLLGRGGMGEVKLAQDHDIGRKVAVKRLLDERNPHAVARFIDEVRTVGSLEHPNIVPIHDVGVDEDGSLFFVMKYVEGETLASIIAKLAKGDPDYHARYGFEHRLDLFAGLLRALQYAHSQGLVHRDVKPENLMVGRYGEVILMDWGIAHTMRTPDRAAAATPVGSSGPRAGTLNERASIETVDGSIVGTPQYMSPEQAAGEVVELDGRSDIYSAFVVLWELLTLTPYVAEGKTAMQTVLAVQEREFPSMIDGIFDHPTQGSVPVELRHFLRHGLAKAKSERYGDADEVLYQLDRVRSGQCAVECPITFMKANNAKLMRLLDRRPGLMMQLATLSLLLFLGGLAGWLAWALS
ncbi:serine/threonine-protein kinase [Nannocystaceae bacterium ST9]